MEGVSRIKKPANLVYGVEDRPPLAVSLLLGLQQLSLWSVSLVFAVIVARSIGIPPGGITSFISLSMIAGGIGTILQALNKKPIGSGYLCPEGTDPSFLAVSIMAAQKGGMPLVFGMTMLAGLFEAFLSSFISRLRALFPPEVTGTIVTMVAITIVPLAVGNLLGVSGADKEVSAPEVIIGLISIGLMMAVNLWGKGNFRLYALLTGMIVGYFCAAALGLLSADSLQQVRQAAWFEIPVFKRQPLWAFDWTMALPFALATICSTLKNVGDITTCQKISDANIHHDFAG